MSVCPRDIRILVVADGVIAFSSTRANGIGQALAAVDGERVATSSSGRFRITTAHRQFDEDADQQNFRFDAAFLASGYDEVWLFGSLKREEDGPTPTEIAVLESFADGGGGIFATGDHGRYGTALSGRLKRMRWMRRWHHVGSTAGLTPAPPSQGECSRDTIWPPQLPHLGGGRHDDDVASLVFPRQIMRDADPHVVHPLFDRGGNQAIRFLPDHMHEGECADFERFDDLPRDAKSEFTELAFPRAVAWAISDSTGNGANVQSRPRLLPICCAHDPEPDNANGRMVSDSTWHRWLVGTSSMLTGEARRDTHKYYITIARWLIPRHRRRMQALSSIRGMVRDPQRRPAAMDAEAGFEALYEIGQTLRMHWMTDIGKAWSLEAMNDVLAAMSDEALVAMPQDKGDLAMVAAIRASLGDLAIGAVACSRRVWRDDRPGPSARQLFQQQAQLFLNQQGQLANELVGLFGLMR